MVSNVTGRFAAVNNTRLYYEMSGTQNTETLVMIHAGICDQRMWKQQVGYFAQSYRVLTLDLRGFGQSPMVEGAFAHYQDLHGLLTHLEIESAWLMGSSLGGKIALDYTLTYPDRVRGLILVGAAISGYQYEGPPHPLDQKLEDAYDSGDMERTSELEVQLWVDGERRKPDEVDSAIRDLVREMNVIPLNVDEELWEQETSLQPPALERLEQITQPALVIVGDMDVSPSRERSAILAERLSNATKKTMPGTAHVPNMEYPAQFNQIVSEYLEIL